VLLVAAALTASATATVGTSSEPTGLLITQVYGGGGTPGSTWTSDFVEITNRGTGRFDLSGWSLQYASAQGERWSVTPLSGSVPPGSRYLIAEKTGPAGGSRLASPDRNGTIDLGTSSGKVALVHSVDPITCRASCRDADGVRDLVGYGDADDAEGHPAPELSPTTAAIRRDVRASAGNADPGGPDGMEATAGSIATAGGLDTDDNVLDFVAATPAPPGEGDQSLARTARIAQIQGRSHVSPLAGQVVTAVSGVVTAAGRTGFWMQDPYPDDDPATSDALFVYTGTAPRVDSGDTVRVAGTVTEYRPAGASGDNLSTTELIRPTVSVTSGAVRRPVPVLIGPGGRMPPAQVRTDAPGDVETSRVFGPAVNALDFYESLEGMLVRVVKPVVTGPAGGSGQLVVLPGGTGSPKTTRGSLLATAHDPNSERIVLDDLLAPLPTANVGDHLPDAVDGVVDYADGEYRVAVLATPDVTGGRLRPETARTPDPDVLTTATIDVGAVDLTGADDSLRRLAAGVVDTLLMPDIVAVGNVPDDSGPADDHVVRAVRGWSALVDAIAEAGGPTYQYRQVDPNNRQDGNGSNRRVGFLYDPARVTFTDREASGPAATNGTAVARKHTKQAGLTRSPGRVAPADPAFAGSSKSLAGQFEFRGQTIFVVANQFATNSADQPAQGRQQPPKRPSEQLRKSQATAVSGFVGQLLAADPDVHVVVLGGLADPAPAALTTGGHLVDLTARLPTADRYSYLAEGNAELQDHLLVSPALAGPDSAAKVIHAQSEFAVRWSDHDPVVGNLVVPGASPEPSGGPGHPQLHASGTPAPPR
jgi:predicted extracellular nuclease